MNFYVNEFVVTNKFIDAHRATLLVQDLFLPTIIGIFNYAIRKR